MDYVRLLTQIHVAISLLAILTGLIVVIGLLTARTLDGLSHLFLTSTVATSVTGFFFPFHGFTPAIGVGIISLIVLAIAIFARYSKHLQGSWRWIYVVTAMISLYLNVFVLVVQSYQKVPALKALAPTQTEGPFVATQLVTLLLFVVLTIFSVLRFRV